MPASSATPLTVEIKSIPSVRVVARRDIVADYQSQGPLWATVSSFMSANALTVAGPCFAIFYDPGFKASDVDTEVCQPIDDDATGAEGSKEVQVYKAPALPRVASLVHTGAYSGMVATYEQLFGWISSQGETVNGPVREIYHVSIDAYGGDDAKLVTEIIVPLA